MGNLTLLLVTNIKYVFDQFISSTDVITIATDLVKRQKKLDLIQKQKEDELLQQQQNQEALKRSIEEMNATEHQTSTKNSQKRSAEELLEDFNHEFKEETEELEESNLLDQIECDADPENYSLEEDDEGDPIRLAYEPCAAHNCQLILKDEFESVPVLDGLVKRLSKNVVNRSKCSALIAEELRNFGKKFAKRAPTRWNSILFTARSLLSVTPEQYKKIR